MELNKIWQKAADSYHNIGATEYDRVNHYRQKTLRFDKDITGTQNFTHTKMDEYRIKPIDIEPNEDYVIDFTRRE